MNIQKAQWTTDGDRFSVSMPLTKVNQEQRLVSGWASLDNLDLQGDIVLAEASERAFSRFRGNIREMHQPIAVGRMISYTPDSYYDSKTEKFYNGIFVTVYVSKGAEATWEKVLDGTLQAFSIKGPIIEAEHEYSHDAGRMIRIIKDYDLEELSLVDSGGNQLANVMSIAKVNGSMTMTGMMAETKTENVFYCAGHESPIAKSSNSESETCFEGHEMTRIGWFEHDGSDVTQKVAGVVAEFMKREGPAEEGGVTNMSDNASEPGTAAPVVDEPTTEGQAESETVEENVANDEAVNDELVEEPAADTETEEAVDNTEVEPEPDIRKMFSDLTETIKKSQTETQESTQRAIADVEAKIEKTQREFDERVASLLEEHTALKGKLDSALNKLEDVEKSLRSELAGVEKSLGELDSSTALKKSGDLGGSKEAPKRGVWGGSIFG